MTTRAAQPRVLTIAPGVPFLRTFVDALLDGRVVPGLSRAHGPLAMAQATIYVPTQRARRALLAVLADASGGATLLPRVAALGILDEDADGGDDTATAGTDVPPAIDALERRMLLADLVLRWSRALSGAIVTVDPQTGIVCDRDRPLLVGTAPADAFALAGELDRLIDAFIIEDVDPADLVGLADADHDPYWQITTRFLAIAFSQWPALLVERGRIDAASRRVRLSDLETVRLAASESDDPVIVLGSTGTNDATARLMAAICRLHNGAVVLPGLDLVMPDDAFALIGQAGEAAHEPANGHPQAALKRLLATLAVARGDIVELSSTPLSERVKSLSAAMLPAEATSAWPQLRAALAPHFATAFDGVDLLEAADERDEALAIAVRLRETLETPHRTAALVTPDRTLARRVRNELRRWDVVIDDSGGEPLAATRAGLFAQLLLAAACENTDTALLALLHHPLARFGRTGDTVAALARKAEAAVFRAGPALSASIAVRLEQARTQVGERHAHPAARRVTPSDWDAIGQLLGSVERVLAPLRALAKGAPLAHWIAAHRDAVDAATDAGAGEDDVALAALFAEPALNAAGLRLDATDYRAMFARLAGERVVPGPREAHPRLKILGLLEARLLEADLVVLAGLDEAIWPPAAQTDAFLNRPMRAALGLSAPERRIGQTAHDFWMAAGAPSLLLTRARKRGGAPTTPSRFLQRVTAFAGEALAGARARGDALAALARTLDTPRSTRPTPRPEPKPPVALRPRQLSVTRIETWIRDPYAIYAERILRLAELGALDEVPGFAEQGTAIHAAIEWATRTFGTGPLPADAAARLDAKGDEALHLLHADPSWVAFRRPRLLGGLAYFLAYHRDRQPLLSQVFTELRGELVVPLADGTSFTLTAEADRIEATHEGTLRVVDFKTGAPPSPATIEAGLAPQLTLEAAMIEDGAFPGVFAAPVAEALYIKLGGKDGGESRMLETKRRSFPDLVAHHRALLVALANEYRDPEKGYASRPIAKWAMRYATYDHLARVKEWSATSGAAGDEP